MARLDTPASLLIFQVSNRLAAFRREDVDRIAPMAELACPPGLPAALEGVLNLAGAAIPVLRLDRLFGLRGQRVGLYSTLVVVRTAREVRIAVLADRVREILSVPESALVAIGPEDSFNGCAEAAVQVEGETVPLLSAARLLVAKERSALAEFQSMAQQRLQQWETHRT